MTNYLKKYLSNQMQPSDKLPESKEAKKETAYNVVEKFLRRVAFNLGNTPSRTEVKVISCIPVDVTELQERINVLATKLDKEIEENEILQKRLEGELRNKEYLKRTIDINYSKNQRRHPDPRWTSPKHYANTEQYIAELSIQSTEDDTHTTKTYLSDITLVEAVKNDSFSEQSFNAGDSPPKSKTMRRKVGNIISRAHTAIIPRLKSPSKKKANTKEYPRATATNSHLNDVHYDKNITSNNHIEDPITDKVASCHLDSFYELNCPNQPPHSDIQTQESLSHSYYDDELYDMVPVKENAFETWEGTNNENVPQKKSLKTKKNHKTPTTQKAKNVYFDKLPSFSSNSTIIDDESLFLKKCQRIYAEMEQAHDVSVTGSTTTGTSNTYDSSDKPDSVLLQIKEILRSLLAEVKTNPAIAANTPHKDVLILKDAVVQKNLEDCRMEPYVNPQEICQINDRKYAFIQPVACCPIVFPNAARMPLCVNCLQSKLQDFGSDSTKISNRTIDKASCNKISSVTERLVKEIYHTMTMSKEMQNMNKSKKGKKKLSQKSIEGSPRQKQVVEASQSETNEESSCTTSCSHSKESSGVSEESTSDVSKSTVKSIKTSQERQKPLKVYYNERIEKRQPAAYNPKDDKMSKEKKVVPVPKDDSSESINDSGSENSYTDHADKIAYEIKKPAIFPSMLTRMIGSISEKIHNAGNRSKKATKKYHTKS